jgi:Tfp pilus assembly protein PilO
MRKPNLSTKRLAIDKTNASLLIIVSISVFAIVFSMVASKALYSQMKYQSKVINKKEATLKQVEKNIKEVEKLNTSYQEFASATTNAIGGNPKGNGDRDGENAKIVLDALPSKYDYPALLTSLNKLVQSGGFQPTSITGTDDELNQATNEASSAPQPVEMPFSVEASVAPADGAKFLQLFEKSIRPVKIRKVSIKGKDSSVLVTIEALTYFQPEKKLNIIDEVVK